MNIIATLNHNMYIYKEASGKSCKLCRSTRPEGLFNVQIQLFKHF